MLRYSYKNQPTIIWWNLVRLAEDTAELFAAADPDDPVFVASGVQTTEEGETLVKRAEGIIESAGEEYKATFLTEYQRVMRLRLGLRDSREDDMDTVLTPLLEMLEEVELDYQHFFRRLGGVRGVCGVSGWSDEVGMEVAGRFLQEGEHRELSVVDAKKRVLEWLKIYAARIGEEGEQQEEERLKGMKKVNPNFVPRNWVLEEIIKRVEKDGEKEVLEKVMKMVERPFEDSWGVGKDEERWTGDVPREKRATQCSCSS